MKKRDVQDVLLRLENKEIDIFKAVDEIMKLSKEDVMTVAIPKEDINEVYKAYPSVCVVRKTHSGKGSSNKEQIKRLLQTKTKEDLIATIKRYVDECRKGKVYMKNFSTFLNNLPDFSEVEKKAPMHMDGRTRNIREITELQ